MDSRCYCSYIKSFRTKMLISIDVDSVLLKTEEKIIEYIFEKYNKKISLKDISYWNYYKDNFPSVLNLFNDINFYNNIEMIADMDYVLENIINKYGYKNIQFVTSSTNISAKSKENVMFKHFNHINNFSKIEIIHVGLYDETDNSTKHEKYHYTKNTILIDDAIHNVDQHINNNKKEALLIDYNYGWNQNYQNDLCFRINKQQDILNTLNKLLRN